MSLFKKKAPKYSAPPVPPPPAEEVQNHQSNGVDDNNGAQKSQLVFHCQQAQGSPLGLISGFSNVKELYQKIAECYDFPPEDVSNKHNYTCFVIYLQLKTANTFDTGTLIIKILNIRRLHKSTIR